MLSERFEMRFTEELLRQIDEWRREQSDLPARAEAIRRLIEAGLGKAKSSSSGGGARKPRSAGKSASKRQ